MRAERHGSGPARVLGLIDNLILTEGRFEKRLNCDGDLVGVSFQREMARVKEMNPGVGNISRESFGSRGAINRINFSGNRDAVYAS